jgi:tRNA pseudouridine55 synthase
MDNPSPTGILVIDKSIGYTSMDVCARIRGKLRRGGAPKRIKVGHGGTLDPMATGVLVVLVGKATPLCNTIMEGEKIYEATIDLSAVSNTDDAEGLIEDVIPERIPSVEQIRSAAATFVGNIMQVPPAFSALNIAGRRAYDIAREGGEVKLAARQVWVRSFEILTYEWPLVNARITSGKGVYIRSLARDIGKHLNCGGMLRALRRTQVGRFRIEDACMIDDLADKMTQADLIEIPEDIRSR